MTEDQRRLWSLLLALREIGVLMGLEAGDDTMTPADIVNAVKRAVEQAKLAGREEGDGWHDAATELPPDGEHVYAYLGNGEYEVLYQSELGWYSVASGGWWDGPDPEQWFLLPHLPED